MINYHWLKHLLTRLDNVSLDTILKVPLFLILTSTSPNQAALPHKNCSSLYESCCRYLCSSHIHSSLRILSNLKNTYVIVLLLSLKPFKDFPLLLK